MCVCVCVCVCVLLKENGDTLHKEKKNYQKLQILEAL